jgi:type IV pilus assembly protein PilN
MIRINLLSHRELAKEENLTHQITLLAASFIVLVFIIVAFHVTIILTIANLEKDIKVQEDRFAELTKAAGGLEGNRRETAILERKLAVINALEENRFVPVRMLDELSRMVIANEIWFEKLMVKGSELTIEGVARNNIAVASFMKSLSGAGFVKTVDLSSTREKEISGFKLQQFVLSCMLKKGS